MMNNSNKISIAEVDNVLRELSGDNEAIRKYISDVLSQGELYGTDSDFHNLAVIFAKLDDYENACAILDVGLKKYTHNVDLLADYLQYGISCGKTGECETYFARLCRIPKRRWTWRGFDFSIDYLMYLAEMEESDEGLDKMVQEMLTIAELYRKYIPNVEGSYQVEASIYHFVNEHDKEIAVLETALQTIKVCPKCCLKLADMYFEHGEIKKALDVLQRAQKDSIRTQWSINSGYVYYLTALCQSILIHENNWFNKKMEIIELYKLFKLAKRTLSQESSYITMLEQQISIFEVKTGKLFDEDETYGIEDDNED